MQNPILRNPKTKKFNCAICGGSLTPAPGVTQYSCLACGACYRVNWQDNNPQLRREPERDLTGSRGIKALEMRLVIADLRQRYQDFARFARIYLTVLVIFGLFALISLAVFIFLFTTIPENKIFLFAPLVGLLLGIFVMFQSFNSRERMRKRGQTTLLELETRERELADLQEN